MKSFIFCTSFIKKPYWPVLRWNNWISYQSERKKLFGAERIFLIDDGTPLENIKIKVSIIDANEPLPKALPDGIVMFRFQEHYGRYAVGIFPGWRRSFTFSSEIAKKYSFGKIIHIESDAFVISRRMINYIRSLRKGWNVFWCPHYNFPETAIQIICGDSIRKLERLYRIGKDFWFKNTLPEFIFPFTNINRRFMGDRYDEFCTKYPANADYICQVHHKMKINDKLFIK